MYSPKLAPPTATCEKTRPGQSSDEGILRDESVRRGLLIWASLRLAVSVLWTGVLVTMTWQINAHYWYQRESVQFAEVAAVLTFAAVMIIIQLVEFTMIVTFIRAGVKYQPGIWSWLQALSLPLLGTWDLNKAGNRSASLYRAYYRYCILTLIIYIIAVTLCIALDNSEYFGEIYITYHINEFPIIGNDVLLFVGAAILDICLEILLIRLIKRLINKYSNEDITNCENF